MASHYPYVFTRSLKDASISGRLDIAIRKTLKWLENMYVQYEKLDKEQLCYDMIYNIMFNRPYQDDFASLSMYSAWYTKLKPFSQLSYFIRSAKYKNISNKAMKLDSIECLDSLDR